MYRHEPFRVPLAFETLPTSDCACPTERQSVHAQPSFCPPDPELPAPLAHSRFPDPFPQ